MIKADDKTKCSGCMACYNICPQKCISMIEDEEGFLYPKVDVDACVNCGLCDRTCPLNEKNNKKYGVVQSEIVQNKDLEVLRQSTSGGAFTPIAQYILQRNGVVFGVEMDEDSNFVKHIKVEKEESLIRFRNSKYVQSYVGNSFDDAKQELQKGRLVCFSGTPCQIQGLKNYLHKEYENLITVDVVCRGVPSPGVWKKYTDYLKRKGKLSSVRFRDKSLGYQYSTMEVVYKDGKIERNGIESDQWLRMFFSGMILRPSCPVCNFRSVERCSDFTIWDCFNVSDLTKDLDETKGATRMLIHTKRGQEIFNEIRDRFYVVDADVNTVAVGITEKPDFNKRKSEFIQDYNKLSMEELLNKWFPMTFKVKVKKLTRRILNGMGLDMFVKKLKRKIGR